MTLTLFDFLLSYELTIRGLKKRKKNEEVRGKIILKKKKKCGFPKLLKPIKKIHEKEKNKIFFLVGRQQVEEEDGRN